MNKDFFKQRVTLDDEITDSTSRGTSGTMYSNQGIMYGGELTPAAQKTLVFLSAVEERKVTEGNGQFFARYRPILDDGDSVDFDQNEGVTDALSNYAGNFKSGIWITPVPYHKKITIGYVADYKNIENISEEQMDQLSYIFADEVDQYIANALADATEMTNTVRGAQVLFGRGKTSDDAITTADTFDISLLNEAETRLGMKTGFYWNSGTLTKSAKAKNPWKNSPEDPYVLIIGKQQKKAFRESSNFLSAAEYGSNMPLLSGEIGMTLMGVRVVVSDNVPEIAKSSEAWDGTTNTTTDIARCFLLKGRAAYVFVWGKEPTTEILPVPGYLRKELRMWGMYKGSVLHADAIIKIDVATNVPVY